jgi:hypothetical protein
MKFIKTNVSDKIYWGFGIVFLGIYFGIIYLKYDYRLLENYFWGKAGVQINALIVGTAWNLRKYMEKLKDNFLLFIFRLFFSLSFYRLAI